MRISNKYIIVSILFFAGTISMISQISQHGLILNGGIGDVNSKIDKSGESWSELGYKGSFSVGYRLRYNRPSLHTFHFDIDVNIGTKVLKPVTYFKMGNMTGGATPDYFTSISGTLNYSFIKNFSIGLGIEPTYYFSRKIPGDVLLSDSDGNLFESGFDSSVYFERKNKFDIPVVAKVAYNFKVFEVGIYGKYGLINVLETEKFKNGKFRDFQLSVFIPF